MAEIVVKLVNGELAGQTAQTITKNVNEASLALKKAEVGTKAWVEAARDLEQAKNVQADYKAQVDATTKASGALKTSFGGILNQIPGFSQISSAFQQAQGSVGGLTSGFGLLKGAIAATGIGLLVIAVSTLVMWFSKTEAGANVLSGALRSIGAVVNVLFGKMMEIGKALYEAFQNPKQLLLDLVDFIQTNLLNRLKAFVVIWDGIKNLDLKKVTDGFIQLNTGIENATDKITAFGKEIGDAAKEAYNFVQVMDDIEDRQAAMEITAKKNENLINQLLLQAKNVGKIYEDRIALLDKADALTRKGYEEQLALSKEYLNAVNKEIDAEKKQQGVQEDTDEQRDKRKEAELAYLNLKGQEIELEEKIANRREQILGKQEKADEKAAADFAKRLAEEEKMLQAFYEEEAKIRDLHNQAQEDSREKDLEQVKLNLQKQIEQLDANSALYADHLSAAQELARKQRDDVNAKWDKTEADRAKKAAEEQKKITDEKTKFEGNMAQVRFETEKGVVDGLGGLLQQGIKDQKAANAIKKGIGLADIGINLAKELSFNAAAAAANPLNAVTFGAAGVAQLAAMNIKSIIFAGLNTARVLLFQKGGFTGAGADNEPAGVVHRNEYVIPANITTNPAYSGVINTLETARLRGYASGGFVTSSPINPFAVANQAAANGGSLLPGGSNFDLEKFVDFMDQRMEKKILMLQVHNNVQDTVGAIQVINGIKAEADT